ncbi:MAG: PPC domain-containing protein [Candidatus Saccharimonas sp.]|nr:PPC domain-containing protein [Planctomycetaceae bacterium]
MRVVPVVCWLLLVSPGSAQEVKPGKQPMIVCAAPLAVVPGRETKLTLRGAFLDEITAVKVVSAEIKVEITSKGKTPVPQNHDAKRVGDTQAEIKFTLPTETPSGKLSLIAVSANGESAAYEIVVAKPDDLIDEKEPNDGFKSAQSASAGKTIVGAIGDARNVDVFRIELAAGQKLIIEITAARAGSLLDPTLTLYDSKGVVVAANDDHAGTRDSRIETTLARPGTYYVTVQDANDSGGPHFAYLLKFGL